MNMKYWAMVFLAACGSKLPARPDSGPPDATMVGFRCESVESQTCEGATHLTCVQQDEFLVQRSRNCAAEVGPSGAPLVCVQGQGCAVCAPRSVTCSGQDALQCNDDGSAQTVVRTCDLSQGLTCFEGGCVDLCQLARSERSYQGCDFVALDLDNASLGAGRDASLQQYGLVVSNPSALVAEVIVTANDAEYGEEARPVEVARVRIAPGDLQAIPLPRREVDGSSSNRLCSVDGPACPASESCVCAGDLCSCRVSTSSSGMNDGTHTALTASGYRVHSSVPVIAYQFNPFTNAQVFSNDASLLLPTSAIGTRYTVVGPPQTIADADCEPEDTACRERDFDPSTDDEDLRSFLTIAATDREAMVDVRLGPDVQRVLGNAAQSLAEGRAGSMLSVRLRPFEVLNLETAGLGADFTGTLVQATEPVAVFSGSEAADAPSFPTYATRRCCADHLEEQLFSDETHGSDFLIARMPPRTTALNAAFVDRQVDSVAEVNEPEYVRVVATGVRRTTVRTSLPAPNDRFELEPGAARSLTADRDFVIRSEQGAPLTVMQTMASQEVAGIPSYYPGGDPAMLIVPPSEQYRRDYVFLTPSLYAFDFVVISAQRSARVLLDGMPLLDPQQRAQCRMSDVTGDVALVEDRVVYRCQLSFPEVGRLCDIVADPECNGSDRGGGRSRDNIRDGVQRDGTHTILSDRPVGVTVYGFDAFVSYAYTAGLNLREILR